MRLRHLGTESNITGCPALYATDRHTFVVQGWTVGDAWALADVGAVADGEVFVEIPRALLRHDDRDTTPPVIPERPGRPAMYATSRDTYLVRGWRVTDEEAIADLLDVRVGEYYLEVPKNVLRHPPASVVGEGEGQP